MTGSDEKKPVCSYCQQPGDLRPYGPKGTLVCFPCATATPERETETATQFITMLYSALDASDTGVVIMDPENGALIPLESEEKKPGKRKKEK